MLCILKHVDCDFEAPSVSVTFPRVSSWVFQALTFIVYLEANSSSHVEHESIRKAGSESGKSSRSYFCRQYSVSGTGSKKSELLKQDGSPVPLAFSQPYVSVNCLCLENVK